jgi:O-acetyl-ADP-ribose deacetylase (regulator of RNase III)
VGTLGNGLAAQFRDNIAGLLGAYKEACENGSLLEEGIFVFNVSEARKVLCMPTKRHWKLPSKIEWIDEAFGVIAATYEKHGITSLAIPAVGCGQGKLVWSDVRQLINKHFKDLPIKVTVFDPT